MDIALLADLYHASHHKDDKNDKDGEYASSLYCQAIRTKSNFHLNSKIIYCNGKCHTRMSCPIVQKLGRKSHHPRFKNYNEDYCHECLYGIDIGDDLIFIASHLQYNINCNSCAKKAYKSAIHFYNSLNLPNMKEQKKVTFREFEVEEPKSSKKQKTSSF